MKPLKTVFLVLGILLQISLIPIGLNQLNTNFDSLNDTDRAILTEWNTYIAAEKESQIWEGYSLADKPILALNGTFGKAFLINPGTNVRSIFAKEIKMPQDFSIKVYRISVLAPQLLQFIIAGNFNTIDKTYSVFGNEVYFTKYNDASVEKKQSSGHYITFLTHEAFHYYMQNDWPDAGRFDTALLTDRDLDLMEELYAVYARIYDELNTGKPGRDKLITLAREYVAVMEKRQQLNPGYVRKESLSETVEGTATYVSLHASEAVGYDFKIMHFLDEKLSKDVLVWPFDTVVPLIKEGKVEKSTIASDWIYQTGALLCELINKLEIPHWQQTLNQQTADSPVTLHSILADFVKSLPAS